MRGFTTAAAVAAAAAVVAFLLIPGRQARPAASEPEPTDGGDLDPGARGQLVSLRDGAESPEGAAGS